MSPLVVWPSVLGLSVFGAGLAMYRGDLRGPGRPGQLRILALGPVFIAAALATFSGEHFTQGREFSQMVPKWLPLRVPLTYFVGICLLAAALSFVMRRGLRWSAPLLSLLFALFVLLIYLPSAITHPGVRIAWIFPFREGTYAVGAFCVTVYGSSRGRPSSRMVLGLRLWTAVVAIFFGLQNILYPQYTPGVPDQVPTSAWVPVPHVIAVLTGVILVALGAAMLFRKTAEPAITGVGILMTALTIGVFAPDLILARGVAERVTAINFVADTLLFAGMMFAIASAVATPVSNLRQVTMTSPDSTARVDSPAVRLPPPIIYVAAIAGGALLHKLLPLPIGGGFPRVLTAWLFVALWAAIMVISFRAFWRARTSIVPIRPATALVETGPYRFTRNPMYVSLVALTVGVGLWMNTWWVILLLVPAVVAIDRLVISREEAYLRRRFGAAYDGYRQRVRRWV